MFLAKLYCASWLVRVFSKIPDLEVLGRVHHEELAQSVHETCCTPCRLALTLTIVVDCAPLDLDNGQLAGIAP